MLKGPVYKWGSTSPMDAFTGRGTHVRPSSEVGPPPTQHSGPLGSDGLQDCGGGSCTNAHDAEEERRNEIKSKIIHTAFAPTVRLTRN